MNKLAGIIDLCNVGSNFLSIKLITLVLIVSGLLQCANPKGNDNTTPAITILPDEDPYIFNIQFQRDSLYDFRLWFPELAIFDYDSSRANTVGAPDQKWSEKSQNGFLVSGEIYKNDMKIDFKYNIMAFSNEVIKLELEVKNTGRLPWSDYAQLAICLAPVSQYFSDRVGNRTFIHAGLDLFRSLKEAGTVRDFNHYPVKHRNDTNDPNQRIRVASGYVSRLSADKKCIISFSWDESARVDVNPGGLDCIHSHPAIGPLEPGNSIKRTGFIVLTHTDIKQNFNFSKDLIDQSLNL
jgi:hypothetical protein